MRPERFESAAFEKRCAGDDHEVIDRVKYCEALKDARHPLDGVEGHRESGKGRIDEKTCQLSLVRRFAEGGNDRTDADAAQNTERRAAENEQQAPMKWHAE